MTSAFVLPAIHFTITQPTAVWAFFVTLSLIALECALVAKSKGQPQAVPVSTRRRAVVLPQRRPH